MASAGKSSDSARPPHPSSRWPTLSWFAISRPCKSCNTLSVSSQPVFFLALYHYLMKQQSARHLNWARLSNAAATGDVELLQFAQAVRPELITEKDPVVR